MSFDTLKELAEMEGPLTQSGECVNDYELKAGESCWVTVGTVSVYIFSSEEGVAVELCRKGDEADDSLDTAFAPF